MSDTIISIDAGNGGTNAVKATPKGWRSIYFPSVRATATGETLGLGDQFELQYDWCDWGSHRYVWGDTALQVSRRGIERHQGAFRYGDEFHQFLVNVGVGQLGIKSGTIDLTLFAPPGMFVEARKTIKERFTKNGGRFAIKFKDDDELRVWHFDSVTVLPEGIGAAACFAIDDMGEPISGSDVLAGDTVILDMGMYTLDALQMSNGNFNPESLGTATWENAGIKSNVLDPILQQVRKAGEDFQLLTLDDIDAVVRQWLTTQDAQLRVAGHELNLEKLIQKYAERYAEWIANNIVDGVFSGLRGIKSAILIGGGAVLTEQYLGKWYHDKLLRFDESDATRKIQAVEANAVGGIRLAKMRLAQKA